ncbi:ThiF family adenylyltransferase [Pedobacter sp. AW31-3R]|uniref:ThiF family adenylyltransferase n=1 Tax=Pedobacter sp. AW31-3R TaxID=3445781 RepID=UPI003F9F91FA
MGNLDTKRYQRQILLKELGLSGQQKLADARVLVIGAGGLGCPALQYLAAAGIGTLGIVDHDTVELSNLHRQILYTVADVGSSKAECAAERLLQLNPAIEVIPYCLQLNNRNALSIIREFDMVIDGSDNFPTRYMVNDACVLLDKPLVYAALSVNEGQLAIFNVPDSSGTKVNYRDVFPEAPKPGEVLNCAEAGVLGVLPGIVGTMQAAEVIKLITGIGTPLINQLLIYNLYSQHTYKLSLNSNTEVDSLPEDAAAFMKMDYNWFCGIKTPVGGIFEIDPEKFRELAADADYTLIDVREEGELPELTAFEHLKLPLSALKLKVPPIEGEKVIVLCYSGIRSVIAAEVLASAYPEKEISSLRGGILKLNEGESAT